MSVERELEQLATLVRVGTESTLRMHNENRLDIHRLESKIDGVIERGARHDERIGALERGIESVWRYIRGKGIKLRDDARELVDNVDATVITIGWAWKLGGLIAAVIAATVAVVLWIQSLAQ